MFGENRSNFDNFLEPVDCLQHVHGRVSDGSSSVPVTKMVYIYVCKKFKVTTEMVSGRDGDWVNNLLQYYCKHARIVAKLERAEINPKKRSSVNPYDSSSEVFKINLVYKDAKGSEHELKWLIKVTRSDVNETADNLLKHEKQVYSRLMGDLINTVKQRAAGRLEGSRVSYTDLLHTPEFIFEETAHQADVLRNVLVIDNLEEKLFVPVNSGHMLNMCHFRMVVKSVAKFHAVSLTYKKVMFEIFSSQSAQAKANRKVDDVEIEGENRVPTGRMGLFARFPFLTNRTQTMSHLIKNRDKFMDMYMALLECFPEESHLVDTFDYIRMSAEDILRLEEDIESSSYADHPLDSIALGVLESRSFLFRYVNDDNKENDQNKKNIKVQRSQSERSKDRRNRMTVSGSESSADKPRTIRPHIGLKSQKSLPGKMENKFLQNVIGKSKDDEKIPITTQLKSKVSKLPPRDPNEPPKGAALISGKYVTYTRVTRDLAVLFFTCGDALIRRYYLIKLLECYAETLGIALGQLGIDTDTFGVNYYTIIRDFQQHVLYGFLVGVLVAMSNTSVEELNHYVQSKGHEGLVQHVDCSNNETNGIGATYHTLDDMRIEALLDLMRDVSVYVESKDFELGLVITNFARYHELFEMFHYDSEYDEDDEED